MDQIYASHGVFSGAECDRFREFLDAFFLDASISSLRADHVLDMRVDRVLAASGIVSKTRSTTPCVYERTWHNIRSRGGDLCIIRLITAGEATISQLGRKLVVRRGDLILNRTGLPLRHEHRPGSDAMHESIWLAIPAPRILRQISLDCFHNIVLQPSRHGIAIRRLLEFLYAHGETLAEDAAEHLISAVVSEVRLAIGDDLGSDRKFQQIRRCITLNFSNQLISRAFVARLCGISVRNLAGIMARHGTTFSDELWQIRLEEAARLLSSGDGTHLRIGQIARMTGFKTAAHFSHRFHQRHGASPDAFRHRLAMR